MSGRQAGALFLLTLGTAATLAAAASVPQRLKRFRTWVHGEGIVLRTCPPETARAGLSSVSALVGGDRVHYVQYRFCGSTYVSPLPPEYGARAAGSRVSLYLNPEKPGDVVTGLGWNFQTFSDPLLLLSFAAVQFAAGLRLLRTAPTAVRRARSDQ